MNGVVSVNKPAGLTSAAVVERVKRLLPRGKKIGHAGTLDPFATGVLLLLIGRATRNAERFMAEPKEYEATIKLGATTETLDCDSAETVVPASVIPTREAVDGCLARFLGDIQQVPPAYSALKVAGRPAYALARRGDPVQLAARRVHISAIELLSYDWPFLRLRVECGRGTYIRSLARDVGAALGTAGYLTTLERMRIGTFRIADAVPLEELLRTGIDGYLRTVV